MEGRKPQYLWVPQVNRECGWGSEERDQEVRVNMTQPTTYRLAFCKITRKPALAKCWRQTILVKLRWQLRTKVLLELQPRVSHPRPLIMQAEGPQSKNAEGAEKGMEDKLWHSMLLPSHRAQTQGLECGCLRTGISSIVLLKNRMAGCCIRIWWRAQILMGNRVHVAPENVISDDLVLPPRHLAFCVQQIQFFPVVVET